MVMWWCVVCVARTCSVVFRSLEPSPILESIPAARSRWFCSPIRITAAACKKGSTPLVLLVLERMEAPLARCSSTKVGTSCTAHFASTVLTAVRIRLARGASVISVEGCVAVAGDNGLGDPRSAIDPTCAMGPYLLSYIARARRCDWPECARSLSERIASGFFFCTTSL